ncbi:hypothetical protein BKA82DRAFT_4100226 [Pisolithus tinctorius]|nr:hypothetical protein BKA82DRAFT_4100226 [Pisolithus tinctorius]
MARKRLHKRPPSSSSESSAQPSSSQPPSGSGLVASVLQKLGMPSYRQADLESNRGLKGKSRAVKPTSEHENPEFFISRIIFLPHGTAEPEDSGHMEDSGSTSGPLLAHLFPVIRCSRAPSATDLTRLEALGLAHANFRDYFQFNRDWSFSQVDSYLHSLFPTLFAYLDSQPRATAVYRPPATDTFPPYHLCVKSRKEVAIASGADFPDGELIYAKVRARSDPPMRDSELFLVTRHKIPYTVLEQWKPLPCDEIGFQGRWQEKGNCPVRHRHPSKRLRVTGKKTPPAFTESSVRH